MEISREVLETEKNPTGHNAEENVEESKPPTAHVDTVSDDTPTIDITVSNAPEVKGTDTERSDESQSDMPNVKDEATTVTYPSESKTSTPATNGDIESVNDEKARADQMLLAAADKAIQNAATPPKAIAATNGKPLERSDAWQEARALALKIVSESILTESFAFKETPHRPAVRTFLKTMREITGRCDELNAGSGKLAAIEFGVSALLDLLGVNTRDNAKLNGAIKSEKKKQEEDDATIRGREADAVALMESKRQTALLEKQKIADAENIASLKEELTYERERTSKQQRRVAEIKDRSKTKVESLTKEIEQMSLLHQTELERFRRKARQAKQEALDKLSKEMKTETDQQKLKSSGQADSFWKSRYETLELEFKGAEQRADSLKRELYLSQAELKASLHKAASHSGEELTLKSQISRLKTKHEREVARIEEEVADAKEELKATDKRLTKERKALKKSSKTSRDLEEKLDSVREIEAEKREKLQTQVVKLKSQIASLAQDLQAEKTKRTQVVASLTQEIQTEKTKHTQSKEKFSKVYKQAKNETKVLKDEFEAHKEEAGEAVEKAQALTKDLAKQKAELKKMRANKMLLDEECNTLKDEMMNLKALVHTLKFTSLQATYKMSKTSDLLNAPANAFITNSSNADQELNEFETKKKSTTQTTATPKTKATPTTQPDEAIQANAKANGQVKARTNPTIKTATPITTTTTNTNANNTNANPTDAATTAMQPQIKKVKAKPKPMVVDISSDSDSDSDDDDELTAVVVACTQAVKEQQDEKGKEDKEEIEHQQQHQQQQQQHDTIVAEESDMPQVDKQQTQLQQKEEEEEDVKLAFDDDKAKEIVKGKEMEDEEDHETNANVVEEVEEDEEEVEEEVVVVESALNQNELQDIEENLDVVLSIFARVNQHEVNVTTTTTTAGLQDGNVAVVSVEDVVQFESTLDDLLSTLGVCVADLEIPKPHPPPTQPITSTQTTKQPLKPKPALKLKPKPKPKLTATATTVTTSKPKPKAVTNVVKPGPAPKITIVKTKSTAIATSKHTPTTTAKLKPTPATVKPKQTTVAAAMEGPPTDDATSDSDAEEGDTPSLFMKKTNSVTTNVKPVKKLTNANSLFDDSDSDEDEADELFR